MEGHRTASPDYLDDLPPWRAPALVRLFGVQKRPLLRTPSGSALWRRAVVCLPRLLWVGLFEPAAVAPRSKPEPRPKDPNEARRKPQLGGAVPAQTQGNAHAHIRALEGALTSVGGDFLGFHQIVVGPTEVLIGDIDGENADDCFERASPVSRPVRAGAREVVMSRNELPHYGRHPRRQGTMVGRRWICRTPDRHADLDVRPCLRRNCEIASLNCSWMACHCG
jgi:hypothetical protein